jgi:hypothetical protein
MDSTKGHNKSSELDIKDTRPQGTHTFRLGNISILQHCCAQLEVDVYNTLVTEDVLSSKIKLKNTEDVLSPKIENKMLKMFFPPN